MIIIWWARRDSNPRPHGCEPSPLPPLPPSARRRRSALPGGQPQPHPDGRTLTPHRPPLDDNKKRGNQSRAPILHTPFQFPRIRCIIIGKFPLTLEAPTLDKTRAAPLGALLDHGNNAPVQVRMGRHAIQDQSTKAIATAERRRNDQVIAAIDVSGINVLVAARIVHRLLDQARQLDVRAVPKIEPGFDQLPAHLGRVLRRGSRCRRPWRCRRLRR